MPDDRIIINTTIFLGSGKNFCATRKNFSVQKFFSGNRRPPAGRQSERDCSSARLLDGFAHSPLHSPQGVPVRSQRRRQVSHSSKRLLGTGLALATIAATLSGCGSQGENSSAPQESVTPATSASGSPTTTSTSPKSTPSTSTPTSSQGSGAGTPTPTAPGKASTTSTTAGVLDTSIERYDWLNATYRTKFSDAPVTLKNGLHKESQYGAGDIYLPGHGETDAPLDNRAHVAYGDVNGDGVEDAITLLQMSSPTDILGEVELWLGQKAGAPKQAVAGFAADAACAGYRFDAMKIRPDGTIAISGKGPGGPSCAEGGSGAPFTATYRYGNGGVRVLTPPPSL